MRGLSQIGLTPAQLLRESIDYLDQFYIQQKTERILARHQNFFSPDRERHRDTRPLPLKIPGLESANRFQNQQPTFGMKTIKLSTSLLDHHDLTQTAFAVGKCTSPPLSRTQSTLRSLKLSSRHPLPSNNPNHESPHSSTLSRSKTKKSKPMGQLSLLKMSQTRQRSQSTLATNTKKPSKIHCDCDCCKQRTEAKSQIHRTNTLRNASSSNTTTTSTSVQYRLSPTKVTLDTQPVETYKPPDKDEYGDPMSKCPSIFIDRLKELKQYDLETARQEQIEVKQRKKKKKAT